MRIIAGDYKGRRLTSPADNRVRPTTDKVKEAIFSILTNEIYGSYVLDLFAGIWDSKLSAEVQSTAGSVTVQETASN